MNKHEFNGGARYVGGKVEKAIGDAVDSRDWQVAGVVDQVAGGAENLYGRAQSIAADAVDTAPGAIDDARAKAAAAFDRSMDTVQNRVGSAARAVRGNEGVAIVAAAATGLLGYALGWLVRGRHA